MLSGAIGERVLVDVNAVADRSDELSLAPPGLRSPNGSCRMVRAADGWIAVNLPRADDLWLVPAWTGCALDAEPWDAIERVARETPSRKLIADARVLGLPVAGVGEIRNQSAAAELHRVGAPDAKPRPAHVIDLSSMWAGPLCGAVLAEAGAAVVKVESRTRPDAARAGAPALFQRLNGAKQTRTLDFAAAGDRAVLRDMIVAADVVITSARPRAFTQLDLAPASLFGVNPSLVWVAVTGFGWTGEGADRVAFGDDAAAAGGLVRWTSAGEPHFLGDALADPITGLAAAAGALRALSLGGGYLVDAAMARCAAGVAAQRAHLVDAS